MNAYTLKNVTFTYDSTRQTALHHFSFSFAEKRTTVLLGPNGAGKSTLMDLLLSFRICQQGSITLRDRPLDSYSKQELGTLVGLVPQEERSRFAFTSFEFTMFGRAPYLHHMQSPSADDEQVAIHALKEVGLLELAHRSVGQLSGGEHQLLLLSRVLAQNPNIILLDEPTSALDPANTGRVITILRRLKEQGKTLIITTHDPSLAAEIADDILMMKKGALLFAGKADEVLNDACLTELYQTPLTTVPFENRVLITRT